MHQQVVFRRLLWIEAAAFALVIVVLWLDELLDLPHILFGAVPTPLRLSECVFESSLALLLAIGTLTVTARAFRRITYLESLVVMCAWCNRVRDGNEWFTMEEFLEHQHSARTTHGICERCASRVVTPAG
jgi:hypothetical protein